MCSDTLTVTYISHNTLTRLLRAFGFLFIVAECHAQFFTILMSAYHEMLFSHFSLHATLYLGCHCLYFTLVYYVVLR